MLNLTKVPITLIAQSGETTTIEPSGYVARVEYERRNVGTATVGVCGGPHDEACRNHIFIFQESPRKIIVERTGQKVALERLGMQNASDTCDITSALRVDRVPESALLIVIREVAEAAYALKHKCSKSCPGYSHYYDAEADSWETEYCERHRKPHPLASRMVWAEDKVISCPTCTDWQSSGGTSCIPHHGSPAPFAYRELHCVAGLPR